MAPAMGRDGEIDKSRSGERYFAVCASRPFLRLSRAASFGKFAHGLRHGLYSYAASRLDVILNSPRHLPVDNRRSPKTLRHHNRSALSSLQDKRSPEKETAHGKAKTARTLGVDDAGRRPGGGRDIVFI